MNQKLLTLAVVSMLGSGAYSQSVTFQYDAAGNQTERKYICVNCLQTKMPESVTADSVSILPELSLYPNPVTASLNITWSFNNKTTAREIQVYNSNGAMVQRKIIAPGLSRTVISFNGLPAGTYIVRIRLTDGKTTSMPVIKL
jgi:hypothetical protein